MAVHQGRQWAPSVDEIRLDHVQRYRWAANMIRTHSQGRPPSILDVGCGCGYGAYLLMKHTYASVIVAGDISAEAIAYAETNYALPNIQYMPLDITADQDWAAQFDSATCFEVLEHIKDPAAALERIGRYTKHLLTSVPNEDVIAYTPARQPYHERHYTEQEFEELLFNAGWLITGKYGQKKGPHDFIKPLWNMQGTLIAECIRKEEKDA